MNLEQYIFQYMDKSLFLIVPGIWVIGGFLKKSPKINKEHLPLILGALGVLFACWKAGATADSALQGAILAFVATFGYDLSKPIQTRLFPEPAKTVSIPLEPPKND